MSYPYRGASRLTAVSSPNDFIPAGLDPERHRIICEHWFGRDPASLAAERAFDPHFQYQVSKVSRLGERAVTELLAEVGSRFDIGDELDATLRRYASPRPAGSPAGRAA